MSAQSTKLRFSVQAVAPFVVLGPTILILIFCITVPTKVHLVKALVFPVVMYRCENWTKKKTEHRRIDVFKLWCWRRLLRVPWSVRRSNYSILKEINPEYSLEGLILKLVGFPSGSDGKASVCKAGDPASIPGLERSPGEGNGSPLQYSCLENPMNLGAW